MVVVVALPQSRAQSSAMSGMSLHRRWPATPVFFCFVAGLAASCGGTHHASLPGATGFDLVEAPPPVVEPEAPGPERRPFLWVVEGGGATSYILGTIHVGVGLDEVLTPAERSFVDGSRLTVLEADISTIDPAEVQAASTLPEDISLKSMLSSIAWHDLVNAAGVPEPALERLRPWAAHALVMVRDAHRAAEAGGRSAPSAGMDLQVSRSAQAAGVPLRYLETPSEQFALFSGVDDAEYAGFLVDYLSEQGEGTTQIEELLEAYRVGNTQAMQALVLPTSQVAAHPELFDAFFFQRNTAWANTLLPELGRGDVFVAVGLGHLLGSRGLIALLEQQGFTIRQVP